MPFATFDQVQGQDPILVWLVGAGNSGKSTLAVEFLRQFPPGVVIPMDMRVQQYDDLAQIEGVAVFPVSPNRADWKDIDRIIACLNREMPGSDVATLVWDSTTPGFREQLLPAETLALLTKEQRQAMAKAGEIKAEMVNRSSLYRGKSLWMEKVASIANHGANTIWVSHEFEGKDAYGKDAVKTTISKQETEKFTRNLTLWLRTFVDEATGRYGVQITKARARPELFGRVYTDEVGMFKGMWERILVDFKSATVIEFWEREMFHSPEDAYTLGLEQAVDTQDGPVPVFNHLEHAKVVYHRIRSAALNQMQSGGWEFADSPRPVQMSEGAKLAASMWKEEVRRRMDVIRQGEDPDAEEAAEAEVVPDLAPEPEPVVAMDQTLIDMPPEPDFGTDY